MPKFSQRHKQGAANAITKRGAPRAIGELLTRGAPVLSQIRDQSARQTFWQSWFSEQVPEALGTHITGAVARDGILTVFAESAAWAARLRYALRELQPAIERADRSVHEIRVRVLPRA